MGRTHRQGPSYSADAAILKDDRSEEVRKRVRKRLRKSMIRIRLSWFRYIHNICEGREQQLIGGPKLSL